MPEQDQQGPDTNTKTNPILKTSRIAAGILFLLLVLGVLFYTRRDLFAPQKVSVPEELILGEVIDSPDIRLRFPDLDKVDSVLYSTDQSWEELIQFYVNKLNNEMWTIGANTNTIYEDVIYFIYAEKGINNKRVSVTIYSETSEHKPPFRVRVTYQDLSK